MIDNLNNFSEALLKFKQQYSNKNYLEKSIVTVDGKIVENIGIKDINGKPNEEFYKWEFIHAMISSGLYAKDYIGTEIYFPKGNKKSAPIKIDAVVFKTLDWIDLYLDYRNNKNQDALLKLRELIVAVIEFKRNEKRIDQVFNSQIKASLKESESTFTLGIYYDEGRLFLFKQIDSNISRYDNSMNYPTSQRVLERFQLEITDPYYLIPSFNDLIHKVDFSSVNKANLKIEDLDVVDKISDENIKNSLSQILRTLDQVSLFNEEGYLLLIQLIAIKIYDEKQSDQYGTNLRFYIEDNQANSEIMSDKNILSFIERIKELYAEAKRYYKNILKDNRINWKEVRHVRVAIEVIKQFQRYSFYRSRRSDLYQLVFYNFATRFKKEENAQFLTPIPIISFIVDILNPRRNETVCDPCCGIADFLSISFINSNFKLDDRNLYGFDNDYNMTVLAQLNMLLNGDGNASILYLPDKGSIDHKLTIDGKVRQLNLNFHKSGNWDNWTDDTELLKYDVILTNPPFGKGRNLNLNKDSDLNVAKLYELYDLYVKENPKAGLDLGVVFLENAVRLLNTNGRFGIVLSNSIASNNTWKFVRHWLLQKIRMVALFDLPSNVFAETGVNTTVIVGYKPSDEKLKNLIKNDYEVYVKEIDKVGYIKRTVNRNVVFDDDYLLDPYNFKTVIDPLTGQSKVAEDFSETTRDFKEWCMMQESDLRKLFLE